MSYKEKGNDALQKGNIKLALEMFTKGIEENPDDHFLYSNRSAVYIALEDYENAMKDAEKTISLKPDWSKGYQRRGNVYIEVEKLEEAEEDFKKALEKDPNSESLKKLIEAPKEFIKLKKLGNEKLTAGKFEEAIKYYTDAIKLKILTYIPYSNRSVAYMQLGKYTEALQDAEECIKARSKFGKGYLRKGTALVALNKLPEAEKAFQEGLKVEHKNSQLEKQLAEVQKKIKEASNFIHIKSEKDYLECMQDERLVVVDFFATWCGPCVQVGPIYEEMSKKYKDVLFLKVDVDKLPMIAMQAKVEAMPTFQFYKKGKQLHVIVGADVHQIISKIEKFK